MEIRSVLLLVLLLIVPASLQAQTDSVNSPALMFPTKPFKLLGWYWQKNGYNLVVGIMPFTSSSGDVRNQFKAANSSSPFIQKSKTDFLNGSSSKSSNDDIYYEVGASASFDLISRHPRYLDKEVRVGIYYQRLHDYYFNQSVTQVPFNDSNKVFYEYSRKTSSLTMKAELFWNTKPFLSRLALYGGAGMQLGIILFDNFSVTRSSFSHMDSLPLIGWGAVYTPELFETHNTLSLLWGVNGVAGIKFNAGCYTNLFVEYTNSVHCVQHFPGAEWTSISFFRFGVRMKLNVWDNEPNKWQPSRPFY